MRERDERSNRKSAGPVHCLAIGIKGMRSIKGDSLAIGSAGRMGAAKMTPTVPAAMKCTAQKEVLTGKRVIQVRRWLLLQEESSGTLSTLQCLGSHGKD